MKNTEWKYWVEFFFLHAFSDDVFHTIFDSVLLKDSVQISRYFISFTLSNAAQQMIASLELRGFIKGRAPGKLTSCEHDFDPLLYISK